MPPDLLSLAGRAVFVTHVAVVATSSQTADEVEQCRRSPTGQCLVVDGGDSIAEERR